MDIRLLKIFRRRASKEICLRRQAGNRYEVVCPINEENTLGCFTKQWVYINSPKASITFKMCTPNGSTFINRIGYNQYDEYIIPFNTNFLTMEEAILEMELLGHNFFVYKDMDTNNTCVLYKRKDGKFGIINVK